MNAVSGFIIACMALSAHGLPALQIIGGNNAPDGLYPYQASLRNKHNKHFCSGAIISKNFIITVAHCLNNLNDPSDLLVAFGSNYLDTPHAMYPGTALILHPDYNRDTKVNDIGLIYVFPDIKFNENIQPIALPTVDRNYDGYSFLVTGWGRLWGGGPQPNNLQDIVVKGYSQNKCSYFYDIEKTHICTLTVQGEGMCNGDSGGLLVTDGVLIGIVSFGVLPCGSGYPDVYTRVFYYRKWINFFVGI